MEQETKILSDWCLLGKKPEDHDWCANRNYAECHCECMCHLEKAAYAYDKERTRWIAILRPSSEEVEHVAEILEEHHYSGHPAFLRSLLHRLTKVT